MNTINAPKRAKLGARLLLGTTLVATVALASCSRTPAELSPPKMHYGEDLCTLCSMIISEERYAASIAYRQGKKVKYMLFDDVGEILNAEIPEHSEAKYYVHDTATLEWIDATSAIYLHSKDLRTPMGYGLAAFKTRAGAEALAKEHAGKILSYAELTKR